MITVKPGSIQITSAKINRDTMSHVCILITTREKNFNVEEFMSQGGEHFFVLSSTSETIRCSSDGTSYVEIDPDEPSTIVQVNLPDNGPWITGVNAFGRSASLLFSRVDTLVKDCPVSYSADKENYDVP